MSKYILTIIIFSYSVNLSSQVCVGDAGKVTWTAWQNLTEYSVQDMISNEDYPHRPDVQMTIYRLQSPINYDNGMGGRIIGFISVPTTDDVTFNVTGDDITRFYLSDGPDPDNMSLRAYADAWSNIAEHDKYPEQTSAPITLTSGTHYYFELQYLEGGGGDHITLYWKTENDDPNNWKIINANFIHQVSCLPSICPELGTPCDDGDSTTTNDLEDGLCNCIGTPNTSNSCIGAHRMITGYIYDSIPGSNLSDLYNDPDFPAVPATSIEHDRFDIPDENIIDSSGTLIQGYLTVPVTGSYKFNLTGNNACIFYMSSDEDPANKSANEISLPWASSPLEHDKFPEQTTVDITLTKGEYYFIEMHHKEGSYGEHYSLFWQTPFSGYTEWKRIPDIYFYDYECEIACIPQGTPCNDGDIFTNNDIYDSNCVCVGTPCVGAECDDPLASYDPYDKCDLTDQLDNSATNNWLSCAEETNPNPLRAASHWVHYDLGQLYQIGTSHVWNYNVSGEEDNGFELVAIDYSVDGVNWSELGTYNWSLADGSSEYSGFVGPDFMGIFAQHVLITSLDDGDCRGIGKVVFNASFCPNSGDSCDDGNPQTENDLLDEFCNCTGTPIIPLNECAIDSLLLGTSLITSDTLSAITYLNSSNTIDVSANVIYVSGHSIDLEAGFEVPTGTVFQAIIESCPEPILPIDPPQLKKFKNMDPKDILHVVSKPDSDIQTIEFHVLEPGKYKLDIVDQSGNVLFEIFQYKIANKGIYYKRLRTQKLDAGVYQIILRGPNCKEVEKFVVL